MEALKQGVRFPHTIKIYRLEDETSFSDGTEEILYQGECLVYGSSQLRTFQSNNVIKCDYAVDIPHLLKGVSGGCLADIEDFNGTKSGLLITSCYSGYYGSREGSTIYLNVSNN